MGEHGIHPQGGIPDLRPVVTYALGIYGPMLTDKDMTDLQKIHNTAARCITGCHPSTPIESLLRIARLWPIKSLIRNETSIWYERFQRMEGTSGYKAAQGTGKDKSWLYNARERERALKMNESERAPLHRKAAIPPWEWGVLERLEIRTEGSGTKKLEKTELPSKRSPDYRRPTSLCTPTGRSQKAGVEQGS
eukprot:TRINITY_DN5725_c0_g3_i1.p1 TRINITY_DN5725_c0_g3~~TRINITY_DN5725_c0_g3_i1.p1  ORF type:complete len:192 (+),score=31.22 TRINITY_DN5725_c0_g3_i1:1868-2443(+)